MIMHGYKGRFVRFVAALAIGGSVFQLGGCDPTVRTTLLGGLETTTNALADTIVSAFFISLQDDDADAATDALTTTTTP